MATENVRFHINNIAVEYALQNGRIKDRYMQSVARSVWFLTASNDITLEYTHISGVLNVKADILSRVFEKYSTKNLLHTFNDVNWWFVKDSACYPIESI